MGEPVEPVWLDEGGGFPSGDQAGPEGLVAVGGDLRPETLLEAYEHGIFPWPWEEGTRVPMLWWCPDPRFVLYPAQLHVSRSLRQRVRSERFDVRMDSAFHEVVRACGTIERPGQLGTWITTEMVEAYQRLHDLGWAHSVECYREEELVGGLYGVSLGGVFFGESMFSREPDASKVALVRLVDQLVEWGFRFIDCQQETEHLRSLGAGNVSRQRFLAELEDALRLPNRQGAWRFD